MSQGATKQSAAAVIEVKVIQKTDGRLFIFSNSPILHFMSNSPFSTCPQGTPRAALRQALFGLLQPAQSEGHSKD
jgi:hypothetical protein